MWSKFYFFCGIAVPRICITQTTAFSCYRFHFIYMHAWCVSCNKGRHNASWLCESVIVFFISLWKLKFLAYILNVTQRFVVRIISYANIVYFIFNYCSWQWMSFIESVKPLGCIARHRQGCDICDMCSYAILSIFGAKQSS